MSFVILIPGVIACEKASATVYYIQHGGIADHGNSTVSGSIAWYLKTYGTGTIDANGEGNKYVLTTQNVNYMVNSQIVVPANVMLRGNSTFGADLYVIKASAGLDKGGMVSLNNGSYLYYLTIDGNREPASIVMASNKTNVRIRNCIIENSKNDFVAADGSLYTLLINANYSSGLLVENCELSNAGANPKINPTTNISKGYGILLWGAANAVVKNNTIAYTSTCGIDFTASAVVDIIGNTIVHTALNRNPTTGTTVGPIADSLTAYHNLILAAEDYLIHNNVIDYAGNHGVHVSGKVLNIQNNTVSNQQLSGIMVDDWRSVNEFSETITIKNNKCGDPLSWVWAPGNSNRKIFVDRVNSGLLLDYKTNMDTSGVLLPVTPSNYRFATIFGSHQ